MKAAVVGLGWWGKEITKRLATSDRITITHGVDPALDGLGDWAGQYGLTLVPDLDAVLGDPAVEAVILATPHSLHEDQVVQSAAAGKQIFCEKPLTLTRAGAERMLEACDKAGVVLGLGHERRWEPAMEKIRDLVESGALGKILHVETNFSHNIFANLDAGNWRLSASDAPAGGMTALGIHLTDFMVSLFGAPNRVFARTGSISFEPPRVDTVAAHIGFRSGISGLLTVLITTPFYGRFNVFGDRGWVEVREISNVDVDDPAELVVCGADGKREVSLHPVIDTVRLNFEAWADAVAGRGEYRIRPEHMLANVSLLEAITISAKTGEIVEIPEL